MLHLKEINDGRGNFKTVNFDFRHAKQMYSNNSYPAEVSTQGSSASISDVEMADIPVDVEAEPPNGEFSLEDQAQWIKDNIKMRVCRTFVKKDSDDDGTLCECGYMKKDHQLPLQLSETDQWKTETHTEAQPTNAFGEIEFIGHGKNTRKFVRVDVDTPMEKMEQLMMNVWGLKKPNLLISVTGGGGFFNMHAKLKEAFHRGLMKAARSTGAWIVTEGTYKGVAKLVGEAVRDYGLTATSGEPVVAIGVANWGCIHKKKELIGQGNGLYPAQYSVRGEHIKVKEECLDPNHTHFILVDNGTEHMYAVELFFRADLEKAVRDAVKVPICVLVLEGGTDILHMVKRSIGYNIPIIIVQGTGRAADILATAYQCSKEKVYVDKVDNKTLRTGTKFDSTQEAKIVDMIKDAFGDQKIKKNWQLVKDSLVNRDLVTVFDLNPASTNQAQRDIDYAILKALRKANKDQVYDQLKLALVWNRIDIAKSEMFVDDNTWKKGSLDDILQSAIMKDRKDFIELFLDHGVSLKDFLTMARLAELYNQIPHKCHLARALRKTKQKYDSSDNVSHVTLIDVGHLIQDLIGDFYASHHLTAIDVSTDVGGTNSRKENYTAQFNPVQELFFWSVLMNRQGLAKLFWHLGKDAMAGALVAYGLLKKLSKNTDDVKLKKSFDRNAMEFSDLAISVLNECHETDEKKAQNLLVRELDNWGGDTCVLIAVKTENKQFISQTACQTLLSRLWMGRLSNENGAIMLLGCVFVPPLMLPFIKYLEEEKNDPSSISMDGDLDDKAKMHKDEGKHGGIIRQLVSIPKKIYDFYTSPVIILIHYVLSYLVFLALFSYMLLVELNSSVSVIEIVLMVWVFSIFAEEIRQFLNPHFAKRMKIRKPEPTEKTKDNKYVMMSTASSMKTKLLSHFTNYWNMVDVLTIVLFVCAFILRILPHHSTLEAARVVYAVTFISFFLRILQIFSAHRELGPNLVMIRKMFYDLSYFMVILMVFVVSYAIASYSILYPNSSLSADVVLKVMRMSYWNLYGELFIEDLELEEPDCSFDPAVYGNNTLPRCPSHVGRYATPIMLGIYVLFVNILLFNLLIAIFSSSIQKIQEEIYEHWNFQPYVLMFEYYSKPPLPTPLILISHIYLFFRWMFRRCCGCCVSNDSDFIKIFDNEREFELLVQWENVIANAYLHRLEMKEFETLDNQFQLIHKRLDEVQDSQKRLSSLEDQMQTTCDSLKLIMNAMKIDVNVSQPGY